MSIALLIQSNTSEGTEQTILVPTESEVLSFHRLSNGQRGRGQRWQTLNGSHATLTELLSAEPIGVVMGGKDVENAKLGNITSLSVKLLSVAPTAPISEITHADMVSALTEALYAGDSDFVNQYVNDARRKNPVILSPIAELEPAFYPATAPVVNEPTNVVPIQPVIERTSQALPTELAQVPDKKWADTYLNRKIAGQVTDYDILDVAMTHKQNVLLRGPAGSGKTMCILGFASSRGYRYYNVSANVGLEPSHLFGAWTPTETAGVFRWQDGPVTDLVRNGGVLLLNEIDFMPERITTVLFGLLDDRREIQLLEKGGEVIKAHPDLLIVGDHNPNYRGSRPMNQAWKDRFSHKLEFGYDKAIERKLIKSKALLDLANQLRSAHDKGELDTPVSTRGLINFVKNAENVSLDYAINSYLNGFGDDEREGVKLVIETVKYNLGVDFGVEVATTETQIDEA